MDPAASRPAAPQRALLSSAGRALLWLGPVYLAGYLGLSGSWLLLGLALALGWARNRRGKRERLAAASVLLEDEREAVRRGLAARHLPAWVSGAGGGAEGGKGGSERPGASRGSESRWEKGALSWKLCGPRDGRSARVVSWGNLPPKMRFSGCASLGDALDIGIQKVYSLSLYCYLTRSNTCMYEHDALCLSSGAEKQPLLAPRCRPSWPLR